TTGRRRELVGSSHSAAGQRGRNSGQAEKRTGRGAACSTAATACTTAATACTHPDRQLDGRATRRLERRQLGEQQLRRSRLLYLPVRHHLQQQLLRDAFLVQWK